MKKIILLCLVLFSFAVTINAQKETTQWRYQLEVDPYNDSNQMSIPGQKSSSLLKMMNIHSFQEDYLMLGHTLRKSILTNQLPIYNFEGKALASSDIQAVLDETHTDTVYTFDDQTWEEQIRVVEASNMLFPTSHTFYQFNQNWEFDTKRQQLSNHISNVDVMYFLLDEMDRLYEEKYLFSLKNKPSKKVLDADEIMETSSVIWAKRTYNVGEFDNIKMREKLLSEAHLSQHKVVSSEGDNTPLSLDDIAFYLEGTVDTLMDFKPDDPDPQVNTVRGESLTAKDITYFKVLQDIYFDKNTKSFTSRILAIAPCLAEYDGPGGDYLYTSTLFWIVYDDDFFNY